MNFELFMIDIYIVIVIVIAIDTALALMEAASFFARLQRGKDTADSRNSFNNSKTSKNKKSSRRKTQDKKKWQATYIAPLQPHTLAMFPSWGILQELVV